MVSSVSYPIKKKYQMANFNIGIDCLSEEDAHNLGGSIKQWDIFQQELDVCDERVSLVSKQGLLDELKKYASQHSIELEVEVWPEGMDYDEAEASDDLEFFSYS